MDIRRRTALVPVVITFLVLLFLNLHGHPSHLWSPWGGWLTVFSSDGSLDSVFSQNASNGDTNFAHGWPCQFTLRPSGYSVSSGKGVPVTVIRGDDYASYGPWPFDGAPLHRFSFMALYLDIVFALATLIGVAFASRYLPTWLSSGRFSLKLLFTLTALVAVVCAFQLWRFASIQTVKIAAMSYIGACFVGILGAGWVALAFFAMCGTGGSSTA